MPRGLDCRVPRRGPRARRSWLVGEFLAIAGLGRVDLAGRREDGVTVHRATGTARVQPTATASASRGLRVRAFQRTMATRLARDTQRPPRAACGRAPRLAE